MKRLEVRQKYSAGRRIFNSLLGVSSGDETLRLMLDILHETLRLTLDVLCQNQELRCISTTVRDLLLFFIYFFYLYLIFSVVYSQP